MVALGEVPAGREGRVAGRIDLVALGRSREIVDGSDGIGSVRPNGRARTEAQAMSVNNAPRALWARAASRNAIDARYMHNMLFAHI